MSEYRGKYNHNPVTWPHPFFLHHQTHDVRNIAPFCHCYKVSSQRFLGVRKQSPRGKLRSAGVECMRAEYLSGMASSFQNSAPAILKFSTWRPFWTELTTHGKI